MPLRVEHRQLEVSKRFDVSGLHQVSYTAYLPAAEILGDEVCVLFCLPGGTLSRAYFDLRSDNNNKHSFAQAMAEHGYIVICIDHPGVGDSDIPDNAYDLTIDLVAAVDACLVENIKTQLNNGSFDTAYKPMQKLKSIGVGHSMGGFITVEIQSTFNSYDALILLGSGFSGHLAMLGDEEKSFANGGQALIRKNAVQLLKKRHGEPLPKVHNALFEQPLIKDVRTVLLGSIGLLTMIPGSIDDELLNIDVPIFFGFGDDDIGSVPQQVTAKLTQCSDMTVVIFPDTGHNHFAFETTDYQFEHIGRWLNTIQTVL